MPRATWRELRSQLPAMPVGDKSEAKRMAPQMRRVGAQSNREACPDQKNDESHEAREAEMIDVEVGGHTWAGAVLHEAVDATAAALHSQSDVGRALDHQLASNNNNNNSSNHNNNNKHTNNSHNDKAVLRFQLDGTAFSNATLEEQGVCIGNLEQRLVHAVASEAWGALCAIIREAAAALSAPRWKEDFPALGAMLPDEARERLRAGLQGRLRKLLCQGLGDLDLSDEGTAALLQPALAFMRRLFAHGGRPLVEAKAGKQWLRLQSLILCGAADDNNNNNNNNNNHYNNNDDEFSQAAPQVAATTHSVAEAYVKHGPLRTVKHGVYTPNPRIQALEHVRSTDADVFLTCSKCGYKVTSCWVFERRGTLRTLIPGHGHAACGGKYVAHASISCIVDNKAILDICPHETQRHICVKCGGSQICMHRKRRHTCKLCKLDGQAKRRGASATKQKQKGSSI
ncbi:unnamed protein product [Polarella glacialis]|uniref:Uncharacterized protein n=1 Tax=Polarella glacialis TaxID=89957 RepID=A0A813DHG6_POLGL|nr:unnamed protein product [Polarella glacialis]